MYSAVLLSLLPRPLRSLYVILISPLSRPLLTLISPLSRPLLTLISPFSHLCALSSYVLVLCFVLILCFILICPYTLICPHMSFYFDLSSCVYPVFCSGSLLSPGTLYNLKRYIRDRENAARYTFS